MSDLSVKKLAEMVRTTPERLIEQLKSAGIEVNSVDETITPEQKRKLLAHLKSKREGSETVSSTNAEAPQEDKPSKITLTRKSVGVVKLGNRKNVSVEFRKKKTFAKPTLKAETTEQETEEELPVEVIAAAVETEAGIETVESKATPEVAPTKTPLTKADSAPKFTDKPKPSPAADEHKKSRKDHHRWDQDRSERDELHMPGRDSFKRKKRRPQKDSGVGLEQGFAKPTAPVIREVQIPESITVADLAQKMSIKAAEIIKVMMKKNLKRMLRFHKTSMKKMH